MKITEILFIVASIAALISYIQYIFTDILFYGITAIIMLLIIIFVYISSM